MKSPQHSAQNFSLPSLPANADTLTRHFYAQFMLEFQSQRTTDSYFRIYTAIEKTASKTGNAPEIVARALVESGLRASRESFPRQFIASIEKRSVMPKWNLNAMTPQQRELMSFWTEGQNLTGYKQGRRFH